MASKLDDGGMAFPGIGIFHGDCGSYKVHASGMSLRDYFAGIVLGGLTTSYLRLLPPGPVTAAVIENTVETAYRHADAMLAKRKKDILEAETQRMQEAMKEAKR